jgi:hypothetical protein
VTAVTAQRRSLFRVTVKAELLELTILDYAAKGSSGSTHSSSCLNISTF